MLAEWFGIRARIMRIGIERMLNDGYYKKIEKEKISRFRDGGQDYSCRKQKNSGKASRVNFMIIRQLNSYLN